MIRSILYDDPEAFHPERFLGDRINPPTPFAEAAFGYGRRICPGRYLSDEEHFIVISSVLATLDISPPLYLTIITDSSRDHRLTLTSDFHSPSSALYIKPRSPKADTLSRATEELNYVTFQRNVQVICTGNELPLCERGS